MFTPDRKPHPAVYELKYCQQPISFSLCIDHNNHDTGSTTCYVKNHYSFCDNQFVNQQLEFYYTYHTDTTSTDKMFFELPTSCDQIQFPNLPPIHTTTTMVYLNIIGILKLSSSWAKKGHVLIQEQIPIKTNKSNILPIPAPFLHSGLKFVQYESEQIIKVLYNNNKILGVWNLKNGSLLEWNHIEIKQMEGNYTRAFTLNDCGGYDLLQKISPNWMSIGLFFAKHFHSKKCSYAHQWTNKVGLVPNHLETIVISYNLSSSSSQIQFQCLVQTKTKKPKILFNQYMTYTIVNVDTIHLQVKVVPTNILHHITSLPRIGFSFQIQEQINDNNKVALYFGRGPHENYPDRKSSAHMGWYECCDSSAGTGYMDYIVPGENGNRCDCQHVIINTMASSNNTNLKDDAQLHIYTQKEEQFHFSILPYSQSEYHIAKHNYELRQYNNDGKKYHVNIDAKLMGVGGDVGYVLHYTI